MSADPATTVGPGAPARASILCRMTGIDDATRHHVVSELETIGSTVRTFIDEHGLGWDVFFAHEAVPAWAEEQRPHTPDEIVQINDWFTSHSDGVIAHGFDDGSAALGMLLRDVLQSNRCVPVLLLLHVDQKPSKYLLGMDGRYPGLTVRRFKDDLTLLEEVSTWLNAQVERIAAGARTQESVQDNWGPIADQIRIALRRCDDRVRREIFGAIPLAPVELERRLEDGTALSDLPVAIFMRLIETLRIDVAEIDLALGAQRLLTPAEYTAWRVWGRTVNRTFAKHVLAAVLDDRARREVGMILKALVLPGAWADRADAWTRSVHN